MRRLGMLLAFTLTIGMVALAMPAQATFPGGNGRIAFSTDLYEEPQIFTVNPDGSGETQLTFDDSGHSSGPDWSPDGTQIAFSGDLTGERQIYVMDADGSNRQQLTSEPGFDHLNPRFSPDGTKIAFAGCPFQETCAIYVMNADGSGETQLTDLKWSSGGPEFSPDGTKIAFDSNMDGFLSAVWVMNADGSNQHRLTAPELEAFYPDWSPDGAHILFTTNCCLPYSNVWVMNADGSGLKQVTHFPRSSGGGGFASYSPDGKKIVLISGIKYRDGCCNDLYRMDADGTHLTRIVADQPAVFLSDWGSQP